MKLLPVCKWMLVLVLLLVGAAGGSLVYFQQKGNALLREELLLRLAEISEDVEFDIGRVRIEDSNRVAIESLTIRHRESQAELFSCRRAVVQFDGTLMRERHEFVPSRIELAGTRVVAARSASGEWNWQTYQFDLPVRDNAIPAEIQVSDLTVDLMLDHGAAAPPSRQMLTGGIVTAIPASRTSWDLDGAINLPGVGHLRLSGMIDPSTKTWELNGGVRDVVAGPELITVATQTAPHLQHQLNQVDALFEKAIDSTIHPSSASGGRALPLAIGRNEPKLAGNLSVSFSVAQRVPGENPMFQLAVAVRNGSIQSSVLPDEIRDISGRFEWNGHHITLQLDQAHARSATLSGNGQFVIQDGRPVGHINYEIRNLHYDSRFRPLLSGSLARIHDQWNPESTIAASGAVSRRLDGQWIPTGTKITVRETEGAYDRFPYPVSEVAGTLTQRPFRDAQVTSAYATALEPLFFDVELEGMARTRPFSVAGVIVNPGAAAEIHLTGDVSDLPIDGALRDAANEESRRVIDSLQCTGLIDARLTFERQPGVGRKIEMHIAAQVHDSRIKFVNFPYTIETLTGDVEYDTRTRNWSFRNLDGRHEATRLTASAEYSGASSPGHLAMTIRTENGLLNGDLYQALPPDLRRIWDSLHPSGRIDMVTTIDWTAQRGVKPIVRIPEATITAGNIRPDAFPYRMTVRRAELEFSPNRADMGGADRVDLKSFLAEHDGAEINAVGWANIRPNGRWRLHFAQVSTDPIPPDDELRGALPPGLRTAISRLDHVGTVAMRNGEFEFFQSDAEKEVTAAWAFESILDGCGANAGLQVDDIRGRVTSKGEWNGQELTDKGYLNLQSLTVLDMQLTDIRGPYSVAGEQLVMGSREVFDAENSGNVQPAERLQAKAFGGKILFDAVADLRDNGSYGLSMMLNDARLEEYAARHLPGQSDLKGIVSAWMNLQGKGDSDSTLRGEGQLQISPASLYELPVVIQLFSELSRLNFNVPNRTAFDYALLSFNVRNRQFQFQPIDLVGESLSLRGRGTVGFDGDVALDFYSQPPRSRRPSIPLVNLIVPVAAQWVRVQVNGTVNNPQTLVRSNLNVDEQLKQFLRNFEPVPGSPVPRLQFPNLIAAPPRSAPQSR